MIIYDGSRVRPFWKGFIEITSIEWCPFCQTTAVIDPLHDGKAHCPKCRAIHNRMFYEEKGCWIRHIDKEIQKLEDKLKLRSKQIRSLRRELRKRN